MKYRILSLLIVIIGFSLGYYVYSSEISGTKKFHLGLDLSGGTHLVYQADTSNLVGGVDEVMSSLRDVIERRVNLFGVSEPVVQIEKGGVSGTNRRLIVELPGVTDVTRAIELIGKTPDLDFRLVDETSLSTTTPASTSTPQFIATGLTGRFLKRAQVQFSNGQGGVGVSQPVVMITFDAEGAKLFEKITRENIGKPLAIFLDGEIISAPVINDAIPTGEAIISGNFTPDEAKQLVRDLNYGALPVPIELVSTQSIGPSLGETATQASIKAGIVGISFVILFMILWYRLPGLFASLSLLIYIFGTLYLFKLIPVTLTAAGIAGFVLSIGMAVDANVLIFERLKEELKSGKSLFEAIMHGFDRAWLSIRDSNISSMTTAIILFWFGTSLVKGFALTFGLGVAISMFTAIIITRTFLKAIASRSTGTPSKLVHFLFGNGLNL